MYLFENCNNIISVEYNEEHFNEHQILISFFHYWDNLILKFISLIIQNGRHFFIYEFIKPQYHFHY